MTFKQSVVVLEPSPATVRYDEMCQAIAAAYKVDEVKHIRDKALAIEVYGKQAKNVEAERQACEIRLRAERKAGQLLKERDKPKPGPSQPSQKDRSSGTTQLKTLPELGISRDQSSKWQKLAEIPDDDFIAALTDPDKKPTTGGIIAAHAEPKINPIDPRAMWLWGRLQDFEREGVLPADPIALFLEEFIRRRSPPRARRMTR